MRKLVSVLVVALLFFGCQNDGKKSKRLLSESSGNINNLSVVIDNDMWESGVGEAIRDVLARPLEGLPQDEPLFSMRQMPTAVFTDFATKNRTVFKVEKGKDADTKVAHNIFAKPQTLVLVTGQTDQEIIDQVNANSAKIIEAFKKEELKEKQRRINLSLHKSKSIKNKFGATIKFPSAYRFAMDTDDFIWLRKDIKSGTMDIMIYQVPLNSLSEGDSLVGSVLRMRDSIGRKYIQGPVEGSYLGTEPAYAPFVHQTILDNKSTIETRGLWDVKNAFMSGPFVNYAIKDEINNRYLVIEGYAFAPSVEKRDYVFELESIIKTVKIE
ncbi:MAG: DUF4837 domain-containing protein [Bacteroidetes bacterium MedPE-SWsnd-G2]|nr:MAG: DUF4837 domain-containing protein [Bacteroidetes bacterium MedPE-SWsnd-G2]